MHLKKQLETVKVPLYLLVAALALRVAAVLLTRFDGLYGQDPFAYFDFVSDLRAALLTGQLPPPFFWPMGYPLLVVLASLVFGLRPLAGQAVSMLAGASIAPLVYLLVREIRRNSSVGAVTVGLLAAVAGQLLISSLSFMSDATGLAWASFSALALLRYRRALGLRWLGLAVFAICAAVLTRWVYALLALPWSVTVLLIWLERGTTWSHRLRASALTMLVILVLLVCHFAPALARGKVSYVGDIGTVGWNPANAFATTVRNSDGVFDYERPTAVFYAIPAVHPSYVFPVLSLFIIVGVIVVLRSPPSLAALLLGWPLVIYLFLAGIAWQNWRFPLPYFPSLLVLVGIAVDWLLEQATLSTKRAIVAIAVLSLVGSLAWAARDIGRFAAWAHSREDAVRWVAATMPQDATLIAFDLTLEVRHYSAIDAIELVELDPEALEDLVANEKELYVVLDPANVESQWRDKRPGTSLAWLRANTEMNEVGRKGPYSLFEVNPNGA